MSTAIIMASQLNLKEILDGAVKGYFDRRGKALPSFTNKLQAYRHDFYHRKHLGTDKTAKFFGSDAASTGFVTNWNKATLSDQELYVIVGFRFREASGVVGAAASDLDFVTPTQNELLNAWLDFEANGVKQLEDFPVSAIDQFADSPNTVWLPRLEVIENSNDMEVRLELADAAGDYWAEVQVIGFKLTPRA